MLRSVNMIGCGRLGQVIASLMVRHGVVHGVGICNRSMQSARGAIETIGAGCAYRHIAEMPPAQVWFITTPDHEIGAVVKRVLGEGRLEEGTVVLHCSGSLSSEVLQPLRARGVSVASVHPVRSFASCELSVREFAGTPCAVEGDSEAIAVAKEVFSRLGGELFTISTSAKMVCHAGHVLASNYLVTLLACARNLYRLAGVPEPRIQSILSSLSTGTLENVLALGPEAALTGPIARGEEELVTAQLKQVRRLSAELGTLYSVLGALTVPLAEAQGVSPESASRLRKILLPLDRSSIDELAGYRASAREEASISEKNDDRADN